MRENMGLGHWINGENIHQPSQILTVDRPGNLAQKKLSD